MFRKAHLIELCVYWVTVGDVAGGLHLCYVGFDKVLSAKCLEDGWCGTVVSFCDVFGEILFRGKLAN